METNFTETRDELIAIWQSEIHLIIQNATNEEEYLETVIYGQQKNAETSLNQQYNYYTLRNYEIDSLVM